MDSRMDRGRDKQYGKQWILTVAILLLLGTALAYERFLERSRIESVEQDRLLIQARVVDDNLSHQLVATYASMQQIANDLRYWRTGDSYQPVANLTLKAIEEAMPGVRTLSIIDAKGITRASSRPELIRRNVSQQEYFKIVRRHHDPSALYLSPPYTTVLSVYAMNLSRMVVGPKGKFNGIIVASLDPEYFKTLLASVQYAPDMWVAIAHGDGIQFMMVPYREGQAGKNLIRPGSFFSRHRESGRDENILTGTIYATGEKRIMALRTIRPASVHLDKPLVVIVGRDWHAIFADWRRDTTIYGGVFIAIVFVTVFSLRHNQIRVMRADEQARAVKTELERNEKKLRDITSSLAEGLYVLNDYGEVLFMNPEAERLLGWTEAELRGRNVHDVVHNRRPDGTLLPFAECRMHNVMKIGTRFISHDEMFIRKDGTILPVSVISAPLKEKGGVAASVTAFRDISDMKQAEQEREELIGKLQKALAEIKTLQGVLPICSNCKKIRDDKGSWRQLEEYISEHTDSRFSHGLCSDCAQKLYPKYFKKDSDITE
jgi:PAS domain S-box-containing protein